MLEKVSGKSWEQLVTQIFCQDLKLNVKFGWPENQKKKDTWGHLTQNDTLIPIASNLGTTLDFTEPAGDLNMSLGDYAKFIKMNLEGLNGVDGYLKSSTYQFLHNGVPNYSMGWFNVAENNQNFSSHTGTGAFTYYSVCQIDKQKLLAYIVFVNSYNDKTKQGVRILLRNLKSIQ